MYQGKELDKSWYGWYRVVDAIFGLDVWLEINAHI